MRNKKKRIIKESRCLFIQIINSCNEPNQNMVQIIIGM
jgi:hypothetical protein